MKRSKKSAGVIILAVLTAIFTSCNGSSDKVSSFNTPAPENINQLEHVKEKLAAPPFLPQYEQKDEGAPKVVEVELTVVEKKYEIEPGVFTWALTYNGTVPGPIIVVHQYDYVEVKIINPASNTMVHNIDFHAATGAMGGGDISHVAPGQQVTFRFRAIKAGVFVYHCAPGGIMVPLHVVSGMNGAIMVLPRNGLTDKNGNSLTYDKAYYIVQQEYYLPKDEKGNYKQYSSPAEGFGDLIKSMKTLTPTHIVFNGKAGALTGENALKANVGDKVLFITSSANRDTRIHLIGGHADLYWVGGSFANKPLADFETWPVPGGTAVAAIYEFRQPGTYALLDHNLIEALAYGAAAQIVVEGKWNNDLMEEVEKAGPIK